MLNLKELNRIHSYVSDIFELLDVTIRVSAIEENHGNAKNLINFINCWEQYKNICQDDQTSLIKLTLCHDLGIAYDKEATLRSSTYTKQYVNKFLKEMQEVKKENEKVKNISIKDLPALISSLKFGSSKKILEERLKTVSCEKN